MPTLNDGPSHGPSGFIILRAPDGLIADLASQAERFGKSRSQLARQILASYLDALKGKS